MQTYTLTFPGPHAFWEMNDTWDEASLYVAVSLQILHLEFALQLPCGCSCRCSCNSQASGLTLHPLLHSLSQDKGNLQERNEEENAQNGKLDVNAHDVTDSEGQFHKFMLQSSSKKIDKLKFK